MDVFVSVIMAAYNAEKTIRIAIESVLQQSYKNLELIVINDSSTDSTKKIIEDFLVKDNRVHLIDNVHNEGVSASRHKGLTQSKGTYIAILDSDDYWDTTKLEKQVDIINKTNAALIYTGVSYIDENNNHRKWIMHVPKTVNYQSLLFQNMIANSSAVVEKTLYSECESMGDRMHEDYACWLKLLRRNVEAVGIDEPLLTYRLSSKSKSGNKIRSGLMIWKTYRYVGLSKFKALFYCLCYLYNGIIKYVQIARS